MTNHSKLQYKPTVFMNTPVPVTLDAADWVILMSWFQHQDTDGVNTIVHWRIGQQVINAVMTRESIHAAEEEFFERNDPMNTIPEPFRTMMKEAYGLPTIPDTPEDLMGDEA